MSNIWINLYSESQGSKIYWRADARFEQIWLFGMMIKELEDGSTIALTPTAEMLDSASAILTDKRLASEIAWAIWCCFCRWQRNEGFFLTGYGAKPSDMEEIIRGKYVKFHRDNTYKSGEETYYYANVRFNNLWINGIKIEWDNATKKLRIIMPSTQSINEAKELISDLTKKEEIAAQVLRLYQRKQSVSSQSNETTGENEAHQDSILPPSTSFDNHTLEKQEDDGDDENKYSKKDKNLFGRVLNADDSLLLKYIAGNVLRPVEMIEKLQADERYYPGKFDEEKCIYAINSGIITPLEIEILSQLFRFRYLTSAMMVDMYGSGYIMKDENFSHFTQTRLNKRINTLMKYNLITTCRFISVDGKGDYDFSQQSIGRIYTLNANGASVLQELGRDASAKAFDSYQDAVVVRERLCVNQWVIYWLTAYPEVMGNHFDFNTVIYRFDLEMSGVRLPSWIIVGDQMLIGQYARRCAPEDKQENLDDMLSKLSRFGEVFSDCEKLFSYKDNEYTPIKLQRRPIINYICEDEQHMMEIAEIIKPEIPDGQEIWLTYDQRVFNYEFEGKRFWKIDGIHEPEWIGADEVFHIGEERKKEKAISLTKN